MALDDSTPARGRGPGAAALLLCATSALSCGLVYSFDHATDGPGGESTYSIGGALSGLEGTVVLRNNGGDDLSLSADGTFAFSSPVQDGARYEVTVLTQPPAQTCSVANASGTVASAPVSNVAITCSADATTGHGQLYTNIPRPKVGCRGPIAPLNAPEAQLAGTITARPSGPGRFDVNVDLANALPNETYDLGSACHRSIGVKLTTNAAGAGSASFPFTPDSSGIVIDGYSTGRSAAVDGPSGPWYFESTGIDTAPPVPGSTTTTPLKLTGFVRAVCGGTNDGSPRGSVTTTRLADNAVRVTFSMVGGSPNVTYLAAETCESFLGSYRTDGAGNGRATFDLPNQAGLTKGFDAQITSNGLVSGLVLSTTLQTVHFPL